MEMRCCRYCNNVYPIDTFELANVIKGIEYRRWRCNKCYIEVKHKRRLELREWFIELKKTKECIECGNSDFRVLDFHHHTDKVIEVSISVDGRWGKDRILSEIDKCDVLCSNCHRILHWEERNDNSQGVG